MLKFIRGKIEWLTLKDRSYEFLFDDMGEEEVVSIDCETTGLNPRKDDIVSIAAVKIRRGRILTSDAYYVTVKPQRELSASSIKIHHITKSDVANEQPIAKELPNFLHFIGNRPLVGYWTSFDVRMLNKQVLKFLNISLQNPTIDVCDLYYERKYGRAPPGTQIDLRFASILADLKLPPLQAHDAFNDAVSTAQAYLMLKDLKKRGIFLSRAHNPAAPFAPTGG